MQTFKDNEGRVWTVELNIASARAIRARMKSTETLASVDFLDYAVLLLSLNDVFFAADLLYCVIQSQAQELGVDSEAFGRALGGDTLFKAISAFTAEYIDFFPDRAVREKLAQVAAQSQDAMQALAETLTTRTKELIDKTLSDVAATLGSVS